MTWVVSGWVLVFLVNNLYLHHYYERQFDGHFRAWQRERKDLLDRLMFAQGSKWVSPPREAPVEEPEEPEELAWKEY